MKERCVHIITGLDVGGAERYLLKLIQSTSVNLEHIVISLKSGGRLEESFVKNARVIILPAFSCKSPIMLCRILGILWRWQPNFLLGWMHYGNLVASFFAIILFFNKKEFAPILVWNVRQSLDNLKGEKWTSRFVIRLCSILSSMPDSLVFNSEHSKRMHRVIGMNLNRARVITNGVNLQQSNMVKHQLTSKRKDLNFELDKKIFTMVARWDHYKDHLTFFRAAKIVLSDSVSNIEFLLVGRNLNHLNPDIPIEIKNSKYFKLLDEISNVEAVLEVSDFLVLSSRSESFPNVLLESMACGTPCISTNVGDAAAIIGNTGFIIEKENPEELAAAIMKALKLKKEEYENLSLGARKRVEENYTIERSAGNYIKMLQEIKRH